MTVKKTNSKKTTYLLCVDKFKEKGSKKHHTNQPEFLFNFNDKN